MEIVERAAVGKHRDQRRCEDKVVVAGHIAAVIDGATSKNGALWTWRGEEVSGGRFAAEVIADALCELVPGWGPERSVRHLGRRLADAIEEQGGAEAERPSAAVAVYDESAGVVWRVGDCPVRIGGEVHRGGKRLDEIAGAMRAAVWACVDAAGEEHEEGDPGRDAILGLLGRQWAVANQAGEFGYGVIDGREVPGEYVEVWEVPGGVEVVLASDGYPDVAGGLVDAEERLAGMLARDPRCVDELRSTKGVAEGAMSFDDRAWVRLRAGAQSAS